LTFIAKDALLVIDDFRPGAAERRRLEGEADLLLDIDSGYRVARAAVAGVNGIAVGTQTLIERLHSPP
jgi:hypothetical protein